jgi:methionyl-tRNA formyltransferase
VQALRIVFFGTPDEAAAILKSLTEENREIIGVVTQPDRPRGRGLSVESSPVKKLALSLGLPVLQPEKLSDKTFEKIFLSLKADIGVVVAYGKIIPKKILEIPKHGFINVHASLLPKYRGAAPIQWALLNGEDETGVTIFKLVEALDAGEVLSSQSIWIGDDDTAGALSKKLFDLGAKLLNDCLNDIERGKVKAVKQNEKLVSFAPKIGKESSVIDWKAPAKNVFNRIRAMNPHPGAHTYYRGKILKILKSEIKIVDLETKHKDPGVIVDIIKGIGFIVATGSGHILIKEVQPAGKKPMKAFDFYLGHRLKSGEVLPS